MSPSLPQRTHFSSSLTGFPICDVCLWVFLTQLRRKRHQIFDKYKAIVTLSDYIHTLMNTLINEGQSEEAAAGLRGRLVWLNPSPYQAEWISHSPEESYFICLCAQSVGHFPKLLRWVSGLRLTCKLRVLLCASAPSVHNRTPIQSLYYCSRWP